MRENIWILTSSSAPRMWKPSTCERSMVVKITTPHQESADLSVIVLCTNTESDWQWEWGHFLRFFSRCLGNPSGKRFKQKWRKTTGGLNSQFLWRDLSIFQKKKFRQSFPFLSTAAKNTFDSFRKKLTNCFYLLFQVWRSHLPSDWNPKLV